MKLVQNSLQVKGTEHKNWTGAASTSDYVSFKNYNRGQVIITTEGWAGGTAAVTLKQATSVAGANVKALSFAEMWVNSGSDDVPVRTTVTSDTFDLDTADKIYIIEIKSDQLDVDNSFDTLQVAIASPGANNDIYGVDFKMYEPRHASETMLSAIID
jgi:hypothetical protein